MAYTVASLPGDGIGVEVLREGLKVLDAVAGKLDLAFDIDEIQCGGEFYLKHGSRDWEEGAEERVAAADVVFLGAVGWPDPDNAGRPVTMANGHMAGWSPVIGTRAKLDLYANVRPVKLFPGVPNKIHGEPMKVWDPAKVDMLMIRENTEDLYSGIGGQLRRGGQSHVSVDNRVLTRFGCERVIRKAFELCKKRDKGSPVDGKLRVTCIAKDNVLEGCRMFVTIFNEIGEEYPEIEKDTAIVDAFTQWLIQKPEWYDVCVTTNMFGDIVTDLASVLQGGMGTAVGANVGDNHAMFEPIHGSAPKHAGKDKANPIATILSVKEGLSWLGERKNDPKLQQAADAMQTACEQILAEGKVLTYDMAGEANAAKCSEVGTAIAERAAGLL
ncbi:MAG: isocitrate/isopropylmalate dehydrogenase family protein, partial [Planctomycetota bacterium]|jgi:3-isopropylmalate dehydrogenase